LGGLGLPSIETPEFALVLLVAGAEFRHSRFMVDQTKRKASTHLMARQLNRAFTNKQGGWA